MGAKCLRQGGNPEIVDLRDKDAQGPSGSTDNTSNDKDPKKQKNA